MPTSARARSSTSSTLRQSASSTGPQRNPTPRARSPASDIALIYDGLPLPAARTTARVGARHFECFAHLLRANTVVVAVLVDERAVLPPAKHPTALRARPRMRA